MSYRKLTKQEIDQLENQNCQCENWDAVLVKEGFSASNVHFTTFSGEVRLGVFEKKFTLDGGLEKMSGLRNVTLHNCTVGDNTLIENVQNYIANYDIGSNCYLQNVNVMVVDSETSFGNGVQVAVLNETGGREVTIFDNLSAHVAYVMALYRYRPGLIEGLQKLIDKYTRSITSSRGTIEDNVKIINIGSIRNVKVGAYAFIDGASRLKNGSINSNEHDPVLIGNNVIATDFIVSSGARVTDGAVIVRSYIGQACQIGHQFSAHDSLFFSNCHCENGEACAIFAGPYTVSMHKSSLMIAGMFSFLNAGSGSNQSNHMYKLGPIHQGIVERGSKTTSDSYILWPAKIGAFSLVMVRHVHHPDTSELPFSYLIENNDQTYLMPGANLRSVGTIRDTQKWPKRDKRKDPCKHDFINFNLLSPYTVSKMLRGYEILNSLHTISGATSAEYGYQSSLIRNSSLHKGIEYYSKGINKFLGNSLIHRLDAVENGDIEKIRQRLKPDSAIGCGAWIDIAGLIVPKSEISKLIDKIERGEIEDIAHVNSKLEWLHNSYYDIEWTWSAHEIEKWYDVKLDEITIDQIIKIVEKWQDAVISLDKLLYEDARKEFSLSSQVGFGIDGTERRRESDFEQVRGSFEQNSFVLSVLKHIEVKTRLGQDTIRKLRG